MKNQKLQFVASDYKERHDAVAKIVHQEISHQLKLTQGDKVPYSRYIPNSILENDQYKLYWDRTLLTDQTVSHNRPDLVLVDKIKKKTTFVEISIPNNNNLLEKNAEKLSKYRELEVRILRQWQMSSVCSLPIIVSTTGIIPRNLLKTLKELGLNENLYKIIQKYVLLLSNARTVRKYLGNSKDP